MSKIKYTAANLSKLHFKGNVTQEKKFKYEKKYFKISHSSKNSKSLNITKNIIYLVNIYLLNSLTLVIALQKYIIQVSSSLLFFVFFFQRFSIVASFLNSY